MLWYIIYTDGSAPAPEPVPAYIYAHDSSIVLLASELADQCQSPLNSAGIVGAGLMGGGIAMCCAEAGMQVIR